MKFAEQVSALEVIVQRIVRESGNPHQFDAHVWLLRWLDEPLPALGGRLPSHVLGEPGGLERLSTLLARIQSGAYS